MRQVWQRGAVLIVSGIGVLLLLRATMGGTRRPVGETGVAAVSP